MSNPVCDMQIIPINRAVICLDCEAISNTHGTHCPACGSTAIYHLQQYAQMQREDICN